MIFLNELWMTNRILWVKKDVLVHPLQIIKAQGNFMVICPWHSDISCLHVENLAWLNFKGQHLQAACSFASGLPAILQGLTWRNANNTCIHSLKCFQQFLCAAARTFKHPYWLALAKALIPSRLYREHCSKANTVSSSVSCNPGLCVGMSEMTFHVHAWSHGAWNPEEIPQHRHDQE